MTPKEKAKDLYLKHNFHIENTLSKNYIKYEKPLSKQLALIAVDEMLNEYPSQGPKDSYEMERHLFWQEVKDSYEMERNLYWQEVKKELEKL